MAQNGMFRKAMRGFNKQDVLQYIDQITAGWDEERRGLEQQAEAAVAAQAQLQSAADTAAAEAAEATQQMQVAQTQLAETQQQVYDTTADLAACRTTIDEMTAKAEEDRQTIARLEAALETVTRERDDAIGAVADGRQQIAELEPLRDQLADAQRSNEELNEQVATMQQTISRYEKVLGNADTAHQRADSIVRPFIEQANRQADETLDSVQAVLAGVLAQLGELQGSVDQRRQALRRCKADSDSRLSSAFGDWLAPTKDINPYDHHFFR